jgi:hypothetical protein
MATVTEVQTKASPSWSIPDAELERELCFGRIVFSLKENSSLGRYDRLAHDSNTSQLVSLVAEPNHVKAIRAMLCSKATASIHATSAGAEAGTKPPMGPEYKRSEPGWLRPDEAGYHCDHHKLDYGLAHATFVTKDPNFISRLSPTSLWATLMSERFSTPLIEEWMPYVTRELARRKLLYGCFCYRAVSGVPNLANSEPLDEIVSTGIKSGELKFIKPASDC